MKEPIRYYCGNGDGMFEDKKKGHYIEFTEYEKFMQDFAEWIDTSGFYMMNDLWYTDNDYYSGCSYTSTELLNIFKTTK